MSLFSRSEIRFSIREISKSPIENKCLFYFGKSNSRLEARGSQLLAGDCIVTMDLLWLIKRLQPRKNLAVQARTVGREKSSGILR